MTKASLCAPSRRKLIGSCPGVRWYGIAVCVGQVGKNWIVAHRRQIFRCAPEQMRPATTEERALVTSPQAELLGIKDLLQGGTFKSAMH